MRVLCIFDPENSPGLVDGDEFVRQKHLAAGCYGGIVQYALPEGSALDKRQAMFRFLRGVGGGPKFDRILFFCHGAPYNLNRKMISDLNVDTFCDLLSDVMTDFGAIVLFSCRTAEFDDGFAVQVATKTKRDVIGHVTSGHTTGNPYKVLVDGASGVRSGLWSEFGGITALKSRLDSEPHAPFDFVEEVLERDWGEEWPEKDTLALVNGMLLWSTGVQGQWYLPGYNSGNNQHTDAYITCSKYEVLYD